VRSRAHTSGQLLTAENRSLRVAADPASPLASAATLSATAPRVSAAFQPALAGLTSSSSDSAPDRQPILTRAGQLDGSRSNSSVSWSSTRTETRSVSAVTRESPSPSSMTEG
jgi:hypothetical protein